MYSQFMLYGQKHIVLPFMSAATLKPIRLECCLPATADCLPPTKWVCFESTVWPDTCRSVHRIRVINGNVWHLLPCLKSVQTVVRRFWFYLLPCLKSVQTVVRRFWFPCSRGLPPHVFVSSTQFPLLSDGVTVFVWHN